MPFQPFAVPARANGTSYRFPVEDTNQPILVSHLYNTTLGTEPVAVRVTLLDDPRSGGFKVKWDYGVIGVLDKSVRNDYPDLSRILASRMNPEVTALISQDASRLKVEIALADPKLIVPASGWPASPWMLFDYGAPMLVDVEASGDNVKAQLATYEQRQFLVRLSTLDDVVAVLMDGDDLDHEVVGILNEEDSAALVDAIAHFEALGLIPVARAYVTDGVVTIEATRTADLTEEQLEPAISPMGELTVAPLGGDGASEPQPGSLSNPLVEIPEGGAAVTQEHDGTWSLHLRSESFPAITPEAIAAFEEEKAARARAAAPAREEPSTEMFAAIARTGAVRGVDPETVDKSRAETAAAKKAEATAPEAAPRPAVFEAPGGTAKTAARYFARPVDNQPSDGLPAEDESALSDGEDFSKGKDSAFPQRDNAALPRETDSAESAATESIPVVAEEEDARPARAYGRHARLPEAAPAAPAQNSLRGGLPDPIPLKARGPADDEGFGVLPEERRDDDAPRPGDFDLEAIPPLAGAHPGTDLTGQRAGSSWTWLVWVATAIVVIVLVFMIL